MLFLLLIFGAAWFMLGGTGVTAVIAIKPLRIWIPTIVFCWVVIPVFLIISYFWQNAGS